MDSPRFAKLLTRKGLRFVFLSHAWYILFMHGLMHGASGAIRKIEIESRLLRGLPVNATALAKEFLVSEDAIRRDLRALAAEGKCKRVYGGGLPISPDRVPFEHRLLNHSKEKRALALAALSLSLKLRRCSSTAAVPTWPWPERCRPIALLQSPQIRSQSQTPSSIKRISKSLFWEERSIVKPARPSGCLRSAKPNA